MVDWNLQLSIEYLLTIEGGSWSWCPYANPHRLLKDNVRQSNLSKFVNIQSRFGFSIFLAFAQMITGSPSITNGKLLFLNLTFLQTNVVKVVEAKVTVYKHLISLNSHS